MSISISIIATIGVYLLSKSLYQKNKVIILSPLIITPLVLCSLLLYFKIPYEKYNEGGQYLTEILKPATVAFAIPLYKNLDLLKKHAQEIVLSVFLGSLLSIFITILLALAFKLNREITASMIPHSITTPFALPLAESLGGSNSLGAVFVMMTGISGIIIGPLLIQFLNLKSAITRGIILGIGAHGTGTSKAFEYGEIEGTFSSLSMILTAIFTVIAVLILAPWILRFI